MPITLPTSPSLGQTFTTNNDVYYWDGTKWVDVSNNTRTVVYLEASASGTFTGGSDISFSTIDSSTTISSWVSTTSGWRIIAPYSVVLNVGITVGGSGSTPINVQLYKINTSGVATSKGYIIDTHTGAFDVSTGSKNIYLQAGEGISLRPDSTSAAGMNAFLTISAASQIALAPTSSTTAAATMVGCKLFRTTAATLTANAINPIVFNSTTSGVNSADIGYDTHNAYNTTTGTFTCPLTGIYQISGHLRFSDVTYAGYLVETILQKNISGTWTIIQYMDENDRPTTRPGSSFVSSPTRMIAGEEYRIAVYPSLAFSFFSPNSRTWSSFIRLGSY